MINISIMRSKFLQYNLSERNLSFTEILSWITSYSDLEWNCEISWEIQVLACVLFQYSMIYKDQFSVNMLQQSTNDTMN